MAMSGVGKLFLQAVAGLVVSIGAGAWAADDAVLRLTFDRPDEPGYRTQHGAEVRIDPAVAIGDEGALWCDTTGSDGEWHEFLHTDREAVPLAADASYRVSWDYRLVSLADDAKLYFLARSAAKPIAHDRGWTSWRAAPGTCWSAQRRWLAASPMRSTSARLMRRSAT